MQFVTDELLYPDFLPAGDSRVYGFHFEHFFERQLVGDADVDISQLRPAVRTWLASRLLCKVVEQRIAHSTLDAILRHDKSS